MDKAREITWELFDRQVEACRLCSLCQNIRHKVPGQGEGPGQVEDEEGLAFVGPAGQLLTKMLEAIQLPRERVYICNVVKCRPPNNRVPTPEEAEACRIHLRMQTWLVRPKVIVLLGSTAARSVLDPEIRITKERGKWTVRKGVWIMPTYHPSALLRDPAKKLEAWEDMKNLRSRLIALGLYQDLYSGEK